MGSAAYTRRIWTVALIVPLCVTGIAWGGFFQPWRDTATDTLFTRHTPPSSIVIVEIDERSLQELGQWPWPRKTFGQLVTRLSAASVIGIDVNFKEPSRLGGGDDAAFGTAIQFSDTPVVVTAELQPDGSLARPIMPLRGITKEGFPNLIIAQDGTSRLIRLAHSSTSSFGLAVAEEYAKSVRIPLSPPRQELTRIHFFGPDRTFAHLSAVDILNGTIPELFFAGKIALIGATAQDLQDFRLTPFGITSGVEIHANIIATILGDRFYTELPGWSLLLITLLSIVAIWITVRIESIRGIIAALVGLGAVYASTVFLLFDRYLVLDIFYPSVAFVASAALSITAQYVTTNREKRFIQETFSRYLAPQVIQELIRDPSKIKLGGVKTTLSILFSDIRGFTTLSETMTPEQLTQFLNRYLTAMTDIVLERQGVVDKYIGDAIMAFWGAPLPNEHHARDAVHTALDMIVGLQTFNTENIASGDPTIDIGVGINSGDVTVGNMGSEKRFDYTVMGDNVNLASRLEGLTKEYGVNILISEATAVHLASDKTVLLREIDRVQVKGKKQGITIFQVVVEHKKIPVGATLDDFIRARTHYNAGEWDRAISLFQKILAHYPDDGPSKTLLNRCRELQTHSPDDWAGVYEMKHK